MGKHAYLIMAHGGIGQLCLLIRAIDHERNDIYLHIDSKCRDDLSPLHEMQLDGNLIFTRRYRISWGG